MMDSWQAYLTDIGISPLTLALDESAPSPASPPVAATASTADALAQLRREIGDCTRCKLAGGRTQLVFGTGNPQARLMFIGEAPGYDEDIQGLPFVGKAGQLLTRMIEAMRYRRDDVYIANILKCRPPNNRNPEPDEIATCKPFLKRQIEIVAPHVIVCLGSFAAQSLLNTEEKISRLRGTFRDYCGTPVMATYHPAFLLRNPEMKKVVWGDLQTVMGRLSKSTLA